MKNFWFIDIRFFSENKSISKLKKFQKFFTFCENNDNIIQCKDFQLPSETFLYAKVIDYYEGERVKIMMKWENKPNKSVEVVVHLTEKKIMELRNDNLSKRFFFFFFFFFFR